MQKIIPEHIVVVAEIGVNENSFKQINVQNLCLAATHPNHRGQSTKKTSTSAQKT
jgi:hypothetical protein